MTSPLRPLIDKIMLWAARLSMILLLSLSVAGWLLFLRVLHQAGWPPLYTLIPPELV